MRAISIPQRAPLPRTLVVALALVFGPIVPAWALPDGEQVVAGGVSVARPDGNNMLIQQSTDKAIVNWNGFSIGAAERVRIQQPGASSVILNRVTGASRSDINGTLSANGKVFLVNPNGVVFGETAAVNVGSLVASTLDVSNADFLAGRHHFKATGAGPAKAVRNAGRISAADRGTVALMGGTVRNDGSVTARLGTVAMGAGDEMTLDLAGDGLSKLTVSRGALEALVDSGGAVMADGGQIVLSARAVGELAGKVVNQTGVLRARTLVERGGRIVLDGGDTGMTQVAGTIDASAPQVGQRGGDVQVLGHHVALVGTASVDASGQSGGGTVLVGGDYQGRNPAVRNAKATYVGAGTKLRADAVDQGDGGKVVAWSDAATRAHGSISARGGARGGNGGLIETSGAFLDVSGARVSAGAVAGRPGEWLLDPTDIQIVSGEGGETNNVSGSPVFAALDSPAIVVDADISAALNAGTSVVVRTGDANAEGESGDLTMASQASIQYGGAGRVSLTLAAHRDIRLQGGAQIVADGAGALDLDLNAGLTPVTGAGSIHLDSVSISTNGGNLRMYGQSDPTGGWARGRSDGEVRVNAVQITDSTIRTGGGSISIRGDGIEEADGVVIADIDLGSVIESTAGGIHIVGRGGHGIDGIDGEVIGSPLSGESGFSGISASWGGDGIAVFNSVIRAASGAVTLEGQGGDGGRGGEGQGGAAGSDGGPEGLAGGAGGAGGQGGDGGGGGHGVVLFDAEVAAANGVLRIVAAGGSGGRGGSGGSGGAGGTGFSGFVDGGPGGAGGQGGDGGNAGRAAAGLITLESEGGEDGSMLSGRLGLSLEAAAGHAGSVGAGGAGGRGGDGGNADTGNDGTGGIGGNGGGGGDAGTIPSGYGGLYASAALVAAALDGVLSVRGEGGFGGGGAAGGTGGAAGLGGRDFNGGAVASGTAGSAGSATANAFGADGAALSGTVFRGSTVNVIGVAATTGAPSAQRVGANGLLSAGLVIEATGAVDLRGLGGVGRGVHLSSDDSVTSGTGTLRITGVTRSSALEGLLLESASIGGADQTGDIVLGASNADIQLAPGNVDGADSITLAGSVIRTTGTVALAPAGLSADATQVMRRDDADIRVGTAIERGFELGVADLQAIDPSTHGVAIGSVTHVGRISVDDAQLPAFNLSLQNEGAGSEGMDLLNGMAMPGRRLALATAGPITVGGPIAADELFIRGTAAHAVSLTDPANAVNRLAVDPPAAFSFVNSGPLVIGAVERSSLNTTTGVLELIVEAESSSQGDFLVQTLSGGLTLTQTVRTLDPGSNITLVSAGNFRNVGGGLVAGAGGRWRVWADTWVGEQRGGLTPSGTSPNFYGCSYDSGVCAGSANLPAEGNRFLYADRPTLTVIADDKSRIYGALNPAFTFTGSGLLDGDTVEDALSGTLGSAATPRSPVGQYAIDNTAGGLVSPVGYLITVLPGTLTIERARLLYVANPATRPVGAANPPFSGTVTGFVLGDTLETATDGTLVFSTGAGANAPPGRYAIDGSGLSAANYYFEQAPGNATALAVTPVNTGNEENSILRPIDESSYIYDRNFGLPPMCFATGPLSSALRTQGGDLLALEWSRVRSRPNLSNCVEVDERNACADF